MLSEPQVKVLHAAAIRRITASMAKAGLAEASIERTRREGVSALERIRSRPGLSLDLFIELVSDIAYAKGLETVLQRD